MRVSIFGLGYVGAVASACIADSGHDVIAIDKDLVKVECIKDGRSPIVEPGLQELIEKTKESGRLSATIDSKQAVLESDISLICVGTPSREDGSLNLDYVQSVCREIGEHLREKDKFHSVVLRSTVTPGTARTVAIPTLEEASGKKAGVGFGFGNNPEFLRESSAIYDYFNPPKIVIGSLDEQTTQSLINLYKGIEAQLAVTSVEVAEGVKYADNVWHATKVGFANELGNILKEHGVDSHKVMDVFFLDRKLNISTAYLKPGFAFGGSCLPKDLRAIRASANNKGLKTPLLDAVLEANEKQVQRAYEMVRRIGKKKVGLMGLSFKAGTDDLRESPLLTLANNLLNDGIELIIYDPDIYKAANMNGANHKYIKEEIPHISNCLVKTPEELLDGVEVFIIGNHGSDFPKILAQANDNVSIIDLVRLKNAPDIEDRELYTGICW